MSAQAKRLAQLENQLRQAKEQVAERDRRLAAAEQRATEAIRLKSEFLARMSHDLRTPMNAIIGYARLLLRRLDGRIEARQYQNLANIETSARHLLDLINDILDLSKVETGRIEIRSQKVDLARLVGECVAAVRPALKEGVRIEEDLDEAGMLHTDPDRLGRALANLLGNAAKFTEQGRIAVAVRRRQGQVHIAVADTGNGIAAADLPHIFDAFRQVARKGQTALEGTGLGLLIARRSIELLGGCIRAESVEGEGSTFTLILPGDEPSDRALSDSTKGAAP